MKMTSVKGDMAECDCQIAGICYNYNHRGEKMRPERRRSKSFGPRCRGLGQVHSLRSSIQDVRASPVSSLLQEEQQKDNDLTDSFEKFPPTRKNLGRQASINDANWLTHPEFDLIDNATDTAEAKHTAYDPEERSLSELSSHRAPVLRNPQGSTLSNYLYYTRQSQPNLSRVGVSDFETLESCERPSGICPNCATQSSRIKVLTRDNDMLRIRNCSLQKQLQSYKKCVSSLESEEMANLRNTFEDEVKTLNEEISAMKELLAQSSSSWRNDDNEMCAIDSVRSAILDHFESKQSNSPQIQEYKSLISDLQITLMETRELNGHSISSTESRLVEENARLLAAIKEQEHTQNMCDARLSQKQALNHQLQSQITALKAELGLLDGVFPKLTDEEMTVLLTKWCELPESVTKGLKSGSNIAEMIGEKESISSPEELIQCLWYRYHYCAKSLSHLQSLLGDVGVKEEDQIETLCEIDLLLIEKDEEIKTLKDELQREQFSKVDVVKEYSIQIKKLTTDKLNAHEIVQQLEDKLKLETISSQKELTPDDSVDEVLERALTELSTAYDIATIKEGLAKIQEDNEHLRVELQSSREKNELLEEEMKSLIKNKSLVEEDSKDLQLFEVVHQLTNQLEISRTELNSEGDANSDIDEIETSKAEKEGQTSLSATFTVSQKKEQAVEKLKQVIENLTWKLEDQKKMLKVETGRRREAEEQVKKASGLEETLTHLANLKEELAQANEDRRGLRTQVTEFTHQITDVSVRQVDALTEKEREISDLRMKLQDSLHCVEDRKNQLEREKRNAEDLKVTYHKEIKNQSSAARRECEEEIEALRKELKLAQRTSQSSEHEKDRLLEEMKALSKKVKLSEKVLASAKMVCTKLMQAKSEDSGEDNMKESSKQIRGIEEIHQALLGDQYIHNEDESTWLLEQPIQSKRSTGMTSSPNTSNNRYLEDDDSLHEQTSGFPNSELQMYSNQTEELFANMMNRLRPLESYSLIDSSGLKQSLNDIKDKYESEQSLLKNHLKKSFIDLKSYKVRMEALDETKRTLERSCEAYEVKLEKLQSEVNSSKKVKEEYNQLITEFEAMKEKYGSVSRNLKDQRRRYKTELEELKQKVRLSEEAAADIHRQIDTLTEKNEALKRSLSDSEKECSRLTIVINEEKDIRKNESMQLQQQITTAQENLTDVQKRLKQKNKEFIKSQENVTIIQTESKKLTTQIRLMEEKYKSEQEVCQRLTNNIKSMEEELSSTKHILSSNQTDKGLSVQLQTQINELRDQLTESKADLLNRDQEMRLKEQQIEWQKQHSTEVESQLTRERSLHVAARSRVEALEDEGEWLRTQLSACKRSAGDEVPTSAGKSRAEQINEIILRSQTRAQEMLANSSDGNFGTFSPPGGPGSEMGADLSMTS